jgi:hypothetical protein
MRSACRKASFGCLVGSWPLVAFAFQATPAAPTGQETVADEAALRVGDLALQSPRIVVENGVVSGVFPVRATFLLPGKGGAAEEARVSAFSFAYRLADGVLELDDGNVVVSGGTLLFEHATVDVAHHGLVCRNASWQGGSSRWQGTAASVSIDPDGRWDASGVLASPCNCAPGDAPWSVSAARMRFEPGAPRATFSGGALRAGGLPVLPVPPGTIPLEARAGGVGLPDLAWTPDGVELGLPLRFFPGRTASVEVEPIYRQERGFRLASQADLPLSAGGFDLAGAGGWDALDEAIRGAASARGGWSHGEARLATDAVAVSDLAWIRDFQADYLSRQLPFEETRAVAGLGPVRLDHDAFQASGAVEQRILGATIALPATGVGRSFGWAQADAAWGGEGSNALDVDAPGLAFEGEQGVGLEGHPGPLDLRGRAWLGEDLLLDPASSRSGRSALAVAATEIRGTLPLWAEHGGFRHLLDLGVFAGAAGSFLDRGSEGSVDLAVPLRIAAGEGSLLWAGPSVSSLWLDEKGTSLHVVADAPLSQHGIEPSLLAWLSRGPWTARASALADAAPDALLGQGTLVTPASGDGAVDAVPLAFVAVGRDDGVFDAEVALMTSSIGDDAVSQGTAGVSRAFSLGGHVLEPGLRLRLDLATGAPLEEQLRLRFSHRRHCLELSASATLAADHDWPDLALSVGTGGR